MPLKILHYFLSLLVFLGVDAIWLGIIAKNLYAKELGNLLAKNIQWWAAGVFYMLFVLGLLIFAVYPSIKAESIKMAAINGALFGFFTYMTYELTNYATIRDWPLKLVPIDIAWGVVLGCVVAIASYLIAVQLKLG